MEEVNISPDYTNTLLWMGMAMRVPSHLLLSYADANHICSLAGAEHCRNLPLTFQATF